MLLFLLQELEGPVRELFIALDVVQVFLCIELALLFFYRGWKNKRALKVYIGWGLVFTCFAVIVSLGIFRKFYFEGETGTPIQILIFIIPSLAVTVLLEYFIQRYLRTRYLFSIIGIILGGLALYSLNNVITMISLFFMIIFGISFFWKFISISTGVVRKNVILFTISFILLVCGWTLGTPANTEKFLSWGIDPVIYGILVRGIQMGSIVLMAAVLIKLPIFFEVNWRDNLIQMFIVYRDRGIPILHTRFQEVEALATGEEELAEDLVAGGMAGITTMLKEISQSTEELKRIDHGDLKILLEHGSSVFIALLVKEEMKIYWDKLERLHRTIDSLFGSILESWNGNLEYFEPLRIIVEEDFQ